MLFGQLFKLLFDRGKLRFQHIDGGLLFRVVAGDDQRGRYQFGNVFMLAQNEIRLGFCLFGLVFNDQLRLRGDAPAVGGDEISVVLHRRFPVVHQMLIDVVGIQQRCALKAGKQRFGQAFDQRLGVIFLTEIAQLGLCRLRPFGEAPGGGGIECGEFIMAEDGGLDVSSRDAQLAVAGAVGLLEQRRTHGGNDLPIRAERIDIVVGDAAAQMGADVLQVFRVAAVDVARQIEVVVVPAVGDFLDRDHACVAGDIALPDKGIDDAMDVLFAQTVLRAVFAKAFGGIDHEDVLARLRVFLVEHNDTGGNTGAVEQIRRQTDDGLDVAALDEISADHAFGIAAEQHTVRKNAGAFAGAFQRAQDVQQIGIVALFGGRRAVVFEALVRVVVGIEASAPAFVAERWIGDHIVEGFEFAGVVDEQRIDQRIALPDFRAGLVVQDHVHARKATGGGVLLLPVQRDLGRSRIANLEQQRAGTAGRVVDGGVIGGLGRGDAQQLRHDPADFGRGVKLALALAAFGREVTHQIFVGVTEDIVAFGAVLGEIERRVFEDGDEVGEAVDPLLAAAELGGIVEVRHIGQIVGVGQRPEDVFVDLIADVALALERDHILEAGAVGNRNGREGLTGVFVTDVLHEQQHEDVILVLAGVHTAAEFVAAGPEGRIEFGFFECHSRVWQTNVGLFASCIVLQR